VKVLVSGGAGFLGSHLCDLLLQEGHEVIALDNFITGRRENLVHLEGEERFILQEGDLCRAPLPEVDAIFHLASPASPVGYGRYPVETMLVNSQGTHRLLELAHTRGALFLLASTSEVYGDPLEHPQGEGYWGNVDPVGPRSCYDESKRFAEALTMVYHRVHGVNARIVRIFNCYGPRSAPDDGRLIPNFVTQALRGQPITVYGDGRQTRSLCYVSDLAQGLRLAMFRPRSRGQIFNLGNPDERPVLEYARLVKEITGTASAIVHVDQRPGEIARRCPDISRARSQLGWSPVAPLEEGLRATIDWFRDLLGVPSAPPIERWQRQRRPDAV
jgi:nucleoside-diphosphate-sugar epimerase